MRQPRIHELEGGVVVAHHCPDVTTQKGWIEIPWVDGGKNAKPRYQAQCPFCHERYSRKVN